MKNINNTITKFISDREIYERTKLSESIPLDTPLVIFIEASRSCNFRCKYCYHSFSKDKAKKLNIINTGIMDFNLYTKIINDIKLFPKKIKCIHISSRGESLINKKLPEMISYAKENNISERINLVTNGSLLTPRLNINLINSGLDSIKISVQGITKQDYKNITDIKIDLQEFIKNIKHLYLNRKNCKIYIKIADIYLTDITHKQKFYDMFSDICDGISVEHIFDIDNDLSLGLNKENDKSIYNKPKVNIKSCPMPFYMLNIGFDGNVIPCCYYKMESFGNLKNTSITKLWKSNKLKEFRYDILKNGRSNIFCSKCNVPDYNTDEKDNIDNYNEQLIRHFK